MTSTTEKMYIQNILLESKVTLLVLYIRRKFSPAHFPEISLKHSNFLCLVRSSFIILVCLSQCLPYQLGGLLVRHMVKHMVTHYQGDQGVWEVTSWLVELPNVSILTSFGSWKYNILPLLIHSQYGPLVFSGTSLIPNCAFPFPTFNGNKTLKNCMNLIGNIHLHFSLNSTLKSLVMGEGFFFLTDDRLTDSVTPLDPRITSQLGKRQHRITTLFISNPCFFTFSERKTLCMESHPTNLIHVNIFEKVTT